MMQDNKSDKNDKGLEKADHGNNNILRKLNINFGNIKKIDRAIAAEFEKRLAFAEDNVRTMLNSPDGKKDFVTISALFDVLFGAENDNHDSFFVGENVIRENVFLCEYLFRCIDSSHRIAEYMKYYSEMQNKKGMSIGDFIEKFDFTGYIYRRKNVGVKITLNDEFSFNKFLSYINLCDFNIIRMSYTAEENIVDFAIDVQNKNFLFNVFLGLTKCYKVSIDIN